MPDGTDEDQAKAESETCNPDRLKVDAIRRNVVRWGREHFQEYPWRSERNLWYCLVAEILLQRTRAKSVVPVYERFIHRFPDPVSLATASESEVEQLITPLGLRWRAKWLKRL